jgi:hypothetical protein
MSPIDLYRQRAMECYLLAEQLSDPDQRRTMRLLAGCWLRLVEQAGEKAHEAAQREAAQHHPAV